MGRKLKQQAYFQTRYPFDESRTSVWRAISEFLQKWISPNATVLDLGAGYCDFINQIKAKKKYALDVNQDVKNYCSQDVEFLHSSLKKSPLGKNSVDVVFASNILEHLTGNELDALFDELERVMTKGGRLIILQPNYYYCYRNYWDDYTHLRAFSHISLSDFLISKNYKIIYSQKRFLPFSFKSFFPKSYLLTKLYLSLPFKPFAKQMLIIAKKA